MAFKIRGILRSMLAKEAEYGINKRTSSSSSSSSMNAEIHKPLSSSSNARSHEPSSRTASILKKTLSPDLAPLMVLAGMIGVVVSIGVHTAKQQLARAPSVTFNKKKRETMHEVDDAAAAVVFGDKFISSSFLRKIAHIQDESKQTLPNPIRGNLYAKSKEAVAESTKPA